MQSSGRPADDYVPGATALIGDDTQSIQSDQSYDHYIDIPTCFDLDPNHKAFAAYEDPNQQNSDSMSFVMDDLKHLHPDDLEEMDILHQIALLSVRISTFTKGLEGNIQDCMEIKSWHG